MKKAKEVAGKKYPICGRNENQVSAGKNRSGTQRCFCKECKKTRSTRKHGNTRKKFAGRL